MIPLAFGYALLDYCVWQALDWIMGDEPLDDAQPLRSHGFLHIMYEIEAFLDHDGPG